MGPCGDDCQQRESRSVKGQRLLDTSEFTKQRQRHILISKWDNNCTLDVCRLPVQNSWRTRLDLPGLISLGSRAGLVLAFQYEVRDEIRDKYGGLQCLFGLHTYRF